MYPQLLEIIKEFHGGILPIKIESKFKLIIKVPKEFILTAKINNGFQFFLTEIKIDENTVPLIISTFYDDKDEPLVIKTPLFEEKLSIRTKNSYYKMNAKFIFLMKIIMSF